jgi:hypothetical protein
MAEWSDSMPAISLTGLIIVPYAVGVAFLLWVLWNLTLELKPRQSSRTSQRVIRVETMAYSQPRVRTMRVLQMESRS